MSEYVPATDKNTLKMEIKMIGDTIAKKKAIWIARTSATGIDEKHEKLLRHEEEMRAAQEALAKI